MQLHLYFNRCGVSLNTRDSKQYECVLVSAEALSHHLLKGL